MENSMKKLYFIPLMMLLAIVFSKNSFSQFQGLIEIKETTYKSKPAKEKGVSDMIPAEVKNEIKKQIKEKEAELKTKSKSDEDYAELANEIKTMKEQLGIFSSVPEEKPKINITKMYLSGNDIRTETFNENEPTGAAIIKAKEKKIIILMDEDKKYMEVDFEALKQMANAFKNMKPQEQKEEEKTPPAKPSIKKTGKSITILGYSCDEYIMEDEGTTSSAWICPNFTTFWKTFAEMGKSFEMDKSKGPNDWFTEVVGESGFPFKTTEKTKDGKLLSEWEITNLDKSKHDASLFAPPKGYTKMNMNDMLNPK
jgi:hypothetical protein